MKKKTASLLAPFTTLAIASFLFYSFGLFPWGNLTLAWCDMRQQVVPLLLDLKNILSGSDGMFLNMGNAGGMSFWGVFFFFLSSPFSFLVAFVDADNIFYFANLLVLLKMAACALTASIFFRRKFPALEISQIVALSVMYSFSGYLLLYYQNVIWLDVMYLFPILLLGFIDLTERNRMTLYTISLAAVITVHYYLSYTAILFLIFAFGIYIFYCAPPRGRGRTTLVLAVSTAIAFLMTAVVWLPSLLQYFRSARTVNLAESLSSGRFYTHLYTTLPILLCTAAIFAAVPFLFLQRKYERKQIMSLFLISFLMFLPLLFEPINKMWHMGSYQAFPSRYGYLNVFLGLILVADVIAQNNRENPRLIRGNPCATFSAFLLLFGTAVLGYWLLTHHFKELTVYTRLLWGDAKSTKYLLSFFCAAALCYFILFFLFSKRLVAKRAFSALLCMMVVTECIFTGSIFMGSASNSDQSYRLVADLRGRLEDDSLYRVKNKQKYFDVNLMGGIGYSTLNHYTSLTDKEYLFFMKKLGFSSYWMEVNSIAATEWTDVLFANRYEIIFSAETKKDDLAVFDNGHFAIVESKFPTSFGLLAPQKILEETELPNISRAKLQQYLFAEILDMQDRLITEYPFTFSDNVDITAGEKMVLSRVIPEMVGTLTYEIEVQGKQTLYFDCFDKFSNRLAEPEYNSCSVSVNGELITEKYPSQLNNGILELGEFTDEHVSITVETRKDLSVRSFGVFGLSHPVLQKALQDSAKASPQFRRDGDRLIGSATAEDGQVLLLPLPYQPEYKASVNGREAEVFKVFDDIMAVPLQEGENLIAISIIPQGFFAGLTLTIAGVALFAVSLCFAKRWKKKKHPKLELTAGLMFMFIFAAAIFMIYVFPFFIRLIFKD